MSVDLKGMSSGSIVPAGTTLRLTFGATHSFTDDDQFQPHYASDVYNRISPVAHLYPATPMGVSIGETVAVMDATNQQRRSAADIVNLVLSLCGWFVELRSIELLSRDQQQDVSNDAGQAERDAAAKRAADVAAATNPLTKFLAGLTDAGKKAAIIAAVLVVLFLILEFHKPAVTQ